MNPETPTHDAFHSLLLFLRDHRGFDFTGYKEASLRRRINKRMHDVGVDGYAAYEEMLETHPDEFVYLFNTPLINVTSFFRDPEAWEYLADNVLPRLVAKRDGEWQVRAWSAGCATGEEAYSLAMLLAEAMGRDEFRARCKVYATDVDEDALAFARHAKYSRQAVEAVPADLRKKYFGEVEGAYVVSPELRRSVVFGRLDLVQDAPISRINLLACRNTLMYFNAETQARIATRFRFALEESGVLFLGRAEMLVSRSGLFAPLDLVHRVFVPADVPEVRRHLVGAVVAPPRRERRTMPQPLRLREAAFDASTDAQLVVDAQGRLAAANLLAREEFGIRPASIGRRFSDLEVSFRPVELRGPMAASLEQREMVLLEEVERRLPSGEMRYYDIRVIPLQLDDPAERGVALVFTDVTHHHDVKIALNRANQDLETAYEELQSTNEELETTNEELQSTNEELETMNEELQARNEELETMNEEMRERGTDLDSANAFLESLLRSIDRGVAVADSSLRVLLWNERAEDLWGLREEEVLGNSILTLDIGLPVEALAEPMRNDVLHYGQDREVTLDAVNRRGRAMRCRITLSPFVGARKDRQGVVLVMEEVK